MDSNTTATLIKSVKYILSPQRTSGRVILEVARLKHGTSSRPSSMSSLPNMQPGTESLSSMENIAVQIPLGELTVVNYLWTNQNKGK